MGLTPCEFMGGDVSGFTKVLDARDQVTRINQDPVRDLGVIVAGMVVRGGLVVFINSTRENPGERIDPGAGAD
jgi:hypothetical protein